MAVGRRYGVGNVRSACCHDLPRHGGTGKGPELGRIYSFNDSNHMASSREVSEVPLMLSRKGEEKTVRQWSKITGLSESVIRMRKKRGWSDERTLSTSVQESKNSRKQYKYNGQYYSLAELSQISQISKSGLYHRIQQTGGDVEKAVNVPKNEWGRGSS